MKSVVPLVLMLTLFGSQAEVFSQDVFEVKPEQIWIPMTIFSPSGQQTIKLESTLYKPQGNGPYPLVIFSHGSTGDGMLDPKDTLRPASIAKLFVERGFVVIAPMRRGRGLSGGEYSEPETLATCAPKSREASQGVENAKEDTNAVLTFVKTERKTLSFIDSSRIILSGHSRGGLLSVIYAAGKPEVKGVVNFSGGWLPERCNAEFNKAQYEEAGAGTKTPMLWLYDKKDILYQAGSIENYKSAFEKRGGLVDLHLYDNLCKDAPCWRAHFLVRFHNVWRNEFGAFLDKLGFKKQ